mmetsp:Transcript_13367/g.31900  ORF Transcript_13367/g.31900 Transcript_13367/m.31900 type:complete len:227 (-) Transcript_13367:1310-1990(-)
MTVVQTPECEFVVLPRALVVWRGEVLECVVHPAQVPLVVEPQPRVALLARHVLPRRRLLGHHHHTRPLLMHHPVHLLEERDCLEVGVSAVLVGQPLAGGAHVVLVDHASHGVDPQPVDVVPTQPVVRRPKQKGAHLMSAKVEDPSAPFLVLALSGVAVLVGRRPVVPGHGPGVFAEVSGDQVEEHADARLVEGVDEVLEVVGGAQTAVGGVLTRHLVAPGPFKGVV